MTARYGGKVRGRFIAGLTPAAVGIEDPEVCEAPAARKSLIEARADALAEEAVTFRTARMKGLGATPPGVVDRTKWMNAHAVVAAYRDRYDITTTAPLGHGPETDLQTSDHAAAEAALRRMNDVARRTERRVEPSLRQSTRLGIG